VVSARSRFRGYRRGDPSRRHELSLLSARAHGKVDDGEAPPQPDDAALGHDILRLMPPEKIGVQARGDNPDDRSDASHDADPGCPVGPRHEPGPEIVPPGRMWALATDPRSRTPAVVRLVQFVGRAELPEKALPAPKSLAIMSERQFRVQLSRPLTVHTSSDGLNSSRITDSWSRSFFDEWCYSRDQGTVEERTLCQTSSSSL
jgi:hypothetical protein